MKNLKKSVLTVLLLISVAGLFSFSNKEENSTVTKDGIVFTESNWKQALEQAKTEKKYVFVDVYATWCGVCKKLKKKSFSDKEAGNYFNKNFINIAVNGETEEGRMIMKKYNLNSYPTLLIVDGNGTLKTKQTGFVKPYILINFGKRIVP